MEYANLSSSHFVCFGTWLFHNHKFSNNYQRENLYKIVTKTQLVIVV